MYRSIFKPFIDISISLFVIIVLFPIIFIVGLLIFIKLGSPIFFSQLRPGKNEKIFKLFKFRTMTEQRNAKGELLPDADRITRLGGFLRNTSLDELPQFINIIKGNLSLVGPRPLLIEYLPLYNDQQKKRHLVKPGITGWAQINGRNAISWEDKFKLDLYYVENLSFTLDVKIIFKTLIHVARGSGVYNDSGVTMEKFKGNKE
jgi:lipopolysaccharide/colanic/teichoic acid biosynthesis glycosyltransferase